MSPFLGVKAVVDVNILQTHWIDLLDWTLEPGCKA